MRARMNEGVDVGCPLCDGVIMEYGGEISDDDVSSGSELEFYDSDATEEEVEEPNNVGPRRSARIYNMRK